MAQTWRNVIFIGETGSGKSSIINLVADHPCAAVSPDASPCTGDFACYDIPVEGRTYRLWDTPGLNKPAMGLRGLFRRPNAMAGPLKKFLQDRYRAKELDLLVFCVQGGRANAGMSKVYDTFCRATRRAAIPVVIAITHLERIQPTMDTWWQENERKLGNLGFVFDGYACLTCLSPNHRKWGAQQDIRALISRGYPQRTLSTLSDREYLDNSNRGCVVC